MKKILMILLVLMMSAGLLTAAGARGAADAETVTLSVALMSLDIPEETQAFLDAFTKAYPHIRIDYVDVGASIEEYLQPRAAAGLLPDFFSINAGSFAAQLADRGMIADLSDTETARKTLPSVKPQFTSPGGKLYGIAGGLASSLIYYNVDLFNKLNVKPAENWEEFLELCETIKRAGHTPIIITPADGTISNTAFSHGFANNVVRNNPDYVEKIWDGSLNFNTPEFAEVYRMVKVLYDRGYTQPGTLSTEYLMGNALFLQGQAAMHFAGTWLAGSLLEADFTTDVFMAPWNRKGETKVPVVATETGWGVAEGPNKKEAIMLLDWLNGPGYTMYQNPRANIPHLMEVEGEVILKPQIQRFLDDLAAYDLAAGLWFEYLPSEIMPLTYKFYQEMLIGDITPEEIAREFDLAVKQAVK